MTNPETADLGARIDACVEKHGLGPRLSDMRKQRAMAKMSASLVRFARACGGSQWKLDAALKAYLKFTQKLNELDENL